MPKAKTRKAAAKRFRMAKSGKIFRRHAKTRHLLECKSSKKMRHLRQGEQVTRSEVARVRAMLQGG